MSKEKRKGKIYRPSFLRRLFYICLLIIAPIQAFYLFSTGLFLLDHPIGQLFLLIVVCLICWQSFVYVFRTYVFVNDDGIGIEGIYKSYIQWDKVERFGWEGFFKSRTWGIKTTETVNPSGYWVAPFTEYFIPLTHVVSKPPSKRFEMIVVGFGNDLNKFAQTPLGQDLMHYAPHLFEEEFIHVDAKRQS